MNWFKTLIAPLRHPVSIAPLAMFRVLFGFMMLVSVLRFIAKGWVYELYIEPPFHFTYYGFEWVKVLSPAGMYLLFGVMAVTALLMMVGLFYRFAAVLFFIAFTYVELIDKTTYLNHYYFVSIVSFLLIWLPAHRAFSLDAYRKPAMALTHIPKGFIAVIMLQLGMVYFFAGVAKLNYDWLINAQPLSIWLATKTDLPIIGSFFKYSWVAYTFSWFGALYDLTIPFFLLYKKTRPYAYAAVIVFHLLTWWLFPIGMFPFIMILSTLVFFPAGFHEKVIRALTGMLKLKRVFPAEKTYTSKWIKPLAYLFIIHFAIQTVMPFRYLLYPGKLFWTEQGFRFSWRVMLMEKMGYTVFYVKDPNTGEEIEEYAYEYLTPQQQKMMATQPDMILEFAHFLRDKWIEQGIVNPEVRVKSFVTLNGEGSRLYINPDVNLSAVKDDFSNKEWILPYKDDEK